MTQSEAILEYIDGTLDHDAEQALFDSMARHPELRSMLRQFIGISAAVHADREAYAPPAHVEHALLSGLGLSPSAAGAITGASTAGGVLAWFGGKLGGMTLSFIAGLALAGSMVYWMTRDGGSLAPDQRSTVATSVTPNRSVSDANDRGGTAGSDGAASRKSGASEESTARGTVVAPSAVEPSTKGTASGSDGVSSMLRSRSSSRSGGDPALLNGGARRSDAVAMTTSRSTASRSDATNTRLGNDGGVATRSDRTDLSTPTPAIPVVEVARPRTAPLAPSALLPADGSALPPAPRAMTPSQSSSIDLPATEGERGAFAEIRGKVGSSLNPTGAKNGSSSLAFMNNLAAGAYVMAGPSFAIGVEGGAEAYDQVLNFDTGDTDKVEQRPIYGWGGVAGRYYLGTIPGLELRPFMQGTLGLTSAGPLGRLRLGTGYDLGAAALNVGVEASTLVYTFNGRPLMSGRWGATLGAEVRLW